MAHYVRETHSYDDDGFTVMGRVVAVLSHSPHNSRVTVLVEKSPTVSFEKVADEATPEGMTLDEIAEAEVPDEDETPRKARFFCNEEKADGDPCEREVEHPDDTCWQHQSDEE